MERPTRTGEARGFTLVELMAVIVIILLLASVAVPVAYRSIVRARESTLMTTLNVTRKAIDDYRGDHAKYPESLSELKEKRYLRDIPFDPVTNSATTWLYDRADDGGIMNIHSGSSDTASDGSAFGGW
jgi:general secretion pathway protein G